MLKAETERLPGRVRPAVPAVRRHQQRHQALPQRDRDLQAEQALQREGHRGTL